VTETPEQHGPESDEAAVDAALAPTTEPTEPETTPAAEDAEVEATEADAEVATPAETEPAADAAEPADEVATPSEAEPTPVDTAVSEAAAEPAASEAEPETAAEEAEAQAAAEEAEAQADAAPAAPTPAPRPGPRPPLPSAMRPRPRPAAPAAESAAPAAPAVPVPAPDDSAEAAAAAEFGRVDEEGTVYVREPAGERAVGQFPGAGADEALALYVRRFLDLQAKVVLFEARLTATDLAVKEIDQTLAKLTEELAEPAAVGDLDGLRTRLEGLRGAAAERRAAVEAERTAARAAAVEARTAIVDRAEKVAQRSGPRIDRPTEEALWKRFSHARTTFDRERRHYFAELESRNAGAKATKEEIVREAERLVTSTEWGATAGAYRDLMARWKAAGRASRADDDALWARFRAAQDAFFQARDEVNAATDREFGANLEVKEALLVEAEAIDVSRGLAAAKSALRSIQDRWEAAGKVPRGDIQRVEARLRAVEATVRDADQAEWRRTNPETRARAEGAAAQLENAIAQLEADLAKAQAGGDARKVKEAQAALDARRSWLEQVQRAAEESRG
jgi:hypothetical protein